MRNVKFDDFESLSQAAAQAFVLKCNEELLKKNSFDVAFSGGNTPKRMYELLATPNYSKNIDWSKVKIALVDERHVPLTDQNSNYKMIFEKLLSKIPIKKLNLAYPKFEKTIEHVVLNYEKQIYKLFNSKMPAFDLMIMGLGKDGHTASLFPKNEALKIKNKTVTAVYLPDQLNRISFTFPVLKKAELLLFLVSGPDKKKAFLSLAEKKSILPASKVMENAIVFSDF